MTIHSLSQSTCFSVIAQELNRKQLKIFFAKELRNLVTLLSDTATQVGCHHFYQTKYCCPVLSVTVAHCIRFMGWKKSTNCPKQKISNCIFNKEICILSSHFLFNLCPFTSVHKLKCWLQCFANRVNVKPHFISPILTLLIFK